MASGLPLVTGGYSRATARLQPAGASGLDHRACCPVEEEPKPATAGAAKLMPRDREHGRPQAEPRAIMGTTGQQSGSISLSGAGHRTGIGKSCSSDGLGCSRLAGAALQLADGQS